MAFSENLQFIRTQAGVTQEQLAEQLGVSRQSVSKWESGLSFPEMETLLRICDLYDVNLDTLLRGSVAESRVSDSARYDAFMNSFSRRVALAIGGILAGCLYCYIKKTDFWKYFDLVMPSVALAQGFGRIGCLLAGCCYGRETNSIFSITFQNSDFAPNHVALIPTQIYSSVLDFLHFGILLYIARHKKKDGQVAACYLIFYSIGRFVLEFFRGDLIRGSVGMLSTSQFISLFILVAGILILVIRSKKKTATDL